MMNSPTIRLIAIGKIIFFMIAILSGAATSAQMIPRPETASMLEATAIISHQMERKQESLIQQQLEDKGFNCDQKAIAYIQCSIGEVAHGVHIQLHEIYDIQKEKRTARAIIEQRFSECDSLGNLQTQFAQMGRPLAPNYEIFSPPAQSHGASAPQPTRTWSFESNSGSGQGRYQTWITQEKQTSGASKCRINILIQSF